MNNSEALGALIDALAALGVPYMVVGSYSSSIWGIPRFTQDADLVVQLEAKDLQRLASQLGPGFRIDQQMSFETITGTHRHILSTPVKHFAIELFLLSDDAHDQERFARRRTMRLVERDVSVASAEDVIITKTRWSQRGRRTKDEDDVRSVISTRHNELDWSYIYKWCDTHGTREALERIRESIPELRQ